MRQKWPGMFWQHWCQSFSIFQSQSPGWCRWWEFEPKVVSSKIVHFLGPSILFCLSKPRKMAAGGGSSFKLTTLDELPKLLRLAYVYSLVHLRISTSSQHFKLKISVVLYVLININTLYLSFYDPVAKLSLNIWSQSLVSSVLSVFFITLLNSLKKRPVSFKT